MGKKTRRINPQETHNIHFSPRTQVQAELWKALGENNLLVVLGYAGTGKTYTCCMKAASWLVRRQIDRIVLARANVSTGKSLGAVPGTLEEKLEPWMLPMLDVLRKALGPAFYDYCMKNKRIDTVALETIRGRSFENSFILVDECQQLTLDEIKAITTRVGEGSVLVMMGDPRQTDLKGKSGIGTFIDLIDRYDPDGVDFIEFELEDIVRSDICAEMVKLFHRAGY